MPTNPNLVFSSEGSGEVSMYMCVYPYLVHVNAYERFRFGKWESVCSHWRSYPTR